MQTLPFDPKLGEAIPLPSNFTVESQTADEIIIIGLAADTDRIRKRHIRITFKLLEKGWIHRHCLHQEKREVWRAWRNPPDWGKSGLGAKCSSDRIIKALLQGTFS